MLRLTKSPSQTAPLKPATQAKAAEDKLGASRADIPGLFEDLVIMGLKSLLRLKKRDIHPTRAQVTQMEVNHPGAASGATRL